MNILVRYHYNGTLHVKLVRSREVVTIFYSSIQYINIRILIIYLYNMILSVCLASIRSQVVSIFPQDLENRNYALFSRDLEISKFSREREKWIRNSGTSSLFQLCSRTMEIFNLSPIPAASKNSGQVTTSLTPSSNGGLAWETTAHTSSYLKKTHNKSVILQ